MRRPNTRPGHCTLIMAVALAAGLAPAADEPKLYKADPGPHEVASDASADLRFAQRERPLAVRVTWPKAEGRFPLIIFSHGAGGSKDGYDPLIEHWASHGYVCIQPTHSDSIKLMKAARRRQLRSAEQFVRDPRTVANWAERPREIKAILDQLGTVAERAEGLGERMDRERIAVAGHSFGAHTTAMIAGLKLFGPGGRTITIADDRPTAALIISPQGLGRSIRPASWAAVDGPVMMITGSKDTSPRNNKSADWRLTAWKHLDPGDDRYLLFIEAAHHNFGGISGVRYPGAGPKNADHLAQVRSATTAYFDALLKDEAKARSYLRSDALEKSTDGEARVEAKREDARPADRP